MPEFRPSPLPVWCGLNVSDDCKGYIELEDCYVDSKRQLWDVCSPCVLHEGGLTEEKLLKIRRAEAW